MAEIKINGRKYEVQKQQVIDAVKGIEPKNIKSYYVVLNRKKYPIKQAVAIVLNIPAIAFQSADAYRLLDKLGFEILSNK